MSELLRKAVEKARILRARPHLKPVAAGGGEVSEAERWRTAQMAQDWLNANADPKYHRRRLPDMEENGQFKLLTRGRLGMRHEFKSYDKTGDEERRDFLRAGIVGAGLATAGGLAGLGLYKAGVSGAAKRAAQLGGELGRARKSLEGIRDWKLGKATAARATAASQKSAYEKTASKFYGDGGAFDKHVSAVARAQAAKAKAAAQAARVAAQAAKAAKAAPAPGQAAQAAAATPPSAAAAATPKAATTKTQIPAGVLKLPSAGATRSTPAAAATSNPAAVASAIAADRTERIEQMIRDGILTRGEAAGGPIIKKKATTENTEGSGDTPRRNNIADLKRLHGFSRVIPLDTLREFGTKMLSKFQLAKIKARRDQRLLDAAAGVKRNRKGWVRPATYEATLDKFGAPIKQKRKWNRAISTTGGLDALVQNASESGGLEGLLKKLSRSDLVRMRYFNQLQTDEGGIPLTGRVPRDRFVKKLRDEDLDRRDANILRAGGAGALAGLLARGRIGASKRALIGAGAGGLGVIGIRALTNNDRDIYGERNRGSKRAELIPAVGGLGAAAWLAGKRFKAFAKKFNHKQFNHGGHGEHGGVKEFGSMSHARIMRKLKAHHSREGGHILISKMPNAAGHPDVRIVSERPSYVGWKSQESNLINKGAFKEQYSKIRQDLRWLIEGKGAISGERARTLLVGAAARDAGLRGVKNFDDHRLYYFKGRNTGIAAKSVEEARSKKRRGGDELVAVRTPSDSEKSQMARGVWVRTRRDGKSPGQSRYGKGRGQGPARKGLSAKLRVLKEFAWISVKTDRVSADHAAARRAIIEKYGNEARDPGIAVEKRDGPSIFASRNNPDSPWYVAPEKREERRLRAKEWHRVNRLRHLASRKESNLASRLRAIKFFEKREKRELNPYVGAALSGGVSGVGLGALSWLKRGTSAASAGKTAAKLGALSAGVVGGGALIGSRIVGHPRKEEGAPFMKRVALGGAITGALVGGAGGLLLRNTKLAREAAKTWRPAKWIVDSPALGAGALGAAGGAVVGAAQGADEGQQVDSIRNLRKDIKQKNFSRLMEFRAFPALAAKQVWKTDPALRADFAKRIVAKVKGAVAANKKQYGVKEFQVSPLNVESMAQTKERRSTERARFLKTTGIIAGMGLAGLGGYRVARVLGKAELRAAKSAAKAAESDTEWMKIRADRYQGQAEVQRRRADNAERRWYQENNSTSGSASSGAKSGSGSTSGSAKASSGSSSGFDWEDLFRTGGRSKSYDDDYVRRSQQARQQSRSSGAGSNSGASSNSGAQGVKNPYAGTLKAEAWEKWKSMDRMAKESPHEGERINAAEARDKWKKRHNLARKLRGLRMFGRDDQPRYRESKAWADPIMGWIRGDDLVDKDGNKWSPSSPQLVNAMHNKARGIRVNVQRGTGLAGDTSAVLQGKDRERDASGRIKKREWEKAWFRNAVTTAGLTVAGLAGAGAWRYGRMNPGTTLGKFVTNTESGVRKTKDDLKRGLGGLMRGADDITGKSKFIRKLLSAKLRLREFDLFASAAGWDARDPRGRSVRVYAPGSRTRVRREKYWHEKTENQRKLMIAAGVGAAALGGLGGVAAYRLAKGKSLVPSFMLKKSPQAAAAKRQLSPEEMKANTDAMSKMAKEQAAKRDAERAANNAKKAAEAKNATQKKGNGLDGEKVVYGNFRGDAA